MRKGIIIINEMKGKVSTWEYDYMTSIDVEVEVHDNEYDVVFKKGEWC